MKKRILVAYLIQLGLLIIARAVSGDFSGVTAAPARLIWAAALAGILVTAFFAVPLLIQPRLHAGGRIGLGRGVLITGIVGLVILNFLAVVLPTAWEAFGKCIPPADMFDGNCEFGPI